MDTTIRRASAADLDALVPLFDAYRGEHVPAAMTACRLKAH